MKKYYVYVLLSKKDNGFYVGLSENPVKRLEEHNRGETKSTQSRRPFVLIYSEAFDSRQKARQREKYLKTGHGRIDLKKFLSTTREIFPGSSIGRAAGC